MARSQQSAVAKHHVVVIQNIAGSTELKIPALYIKVGDQTVLVHSLVDYFLAYPTRSLNWKRKVSRALGLFYDFCISYNLVRQSSQTFNFHKRLIRKFALSLYKGTIDVEDHRDKLNLYWPPASMISTKSILSALQTFIDWCEVEGVIEPQPSNVPTHPRDERTTLRFLYQAVKAKAFMFLSHTVTTSELARGIADKQANKIIDLGVNQKACGEAKKFPTELVSPLMKYGFIKKESATLPEEREDLTAKMITLLLLFGGTRISEPFHIWYNDVVPQFDGSCKVLLRHPSEAYTDMVGEQKMLRRTYLAQRNLKPRNDDRNSKSYKAGWKNLKVDSTLSAPVFFIHPSAESLFREMYIYYLSYRERLMKSYTDRCGTDHPFLFVKQTGNAGEPYSIKAYQDALKRAYKRLEKRLGRPVKYGKLEGTSPHGPRHFYGQMLAESGVPPKIIQNSLRHRSVLSQGIYTEPTFDHVTRELEKARHLIEINGCTSLGKPGADELEWKHD
ncbi:MAG: gamma-mobile-trio recombinase GmtY [Aestuariibacter sp.]